MSRDATIKSFQVGAGMAAIIWREAAGDDGEEIPNAAYHAAGALLEIYARVNGETVDEFVRRIDDVFGSKAEDRYVSIGEDLAIAALHEMPFGHGIETPHFEVTVEDDDIVWDGGERLHGNWSGSEVQSLLFDREIFSATRAKEWAKSHGFKYGSIDTTDRYHRLRQHDPDGQPCRTISFGESGIKAVVCAAAKNPPWKPIGVEPGGRYRTYYPDGRKSWAFEDGVLAADWAKEIGGTVEDHGPGGYVHYGRNPVGDEVDVVRGPGRGRRGVVEHETSRVARVRFAEGGGRAHLERGDLRTRGRGR